MDQITANGDQLHLSEVGVKGGGGAESPNPLLTELIPWPPAPILRPFRSHLISIQRTDITLEILRFEELWAGRQAGRGSLPWGNGTL